MPEPDDAETCFTASADGVAVAYTSRGAGKPALVLIHGWSCDKSYWAAQIEPLSSEFQVIALDLGGHGESASGRTSWTIDSFAHDVAAVVEAEDPGPVVLVGHSMGGTVAVAAARLLGKRVAKLVLVDTYRKLGSPRSAEEVQELLAPFREDFRTRTDTYVRGMFGGGADEELVRRVTEAMSAAPPATAIPALESSLSYGRTVTESLAKVASPVVAINAQAPPEDVQSLQRYGVEVVTIPAVGHFVMMEAPRRFNEVLRRIVAG